MQCAQNPMWQQAMQQMLSNPEMLRSSVDAAAAANPQIRQMLDRDPSMRCGSIMHKHNLSSSGMESYTELSVYPSCVDACRDFDAVPA